MVPEYFSTVSILGDLDVLGRVISWSEHCDLSDLRAMLICSIVLDYHIFDLCNNYYIGLYME